MLGEYMTSVGYGAYESDSGMGFAFNGLDGFGGLPEAALRVLFAPEEVKEGDFPLAGEFVGAKLSKAFQIIKEGEKYFIVPKGADSIAAIASSVVGGGAVGKLVGAIAGSATDAAGEIASVRVELPDKSTRIEQRTSVGGTLIYEPAGMNMLLVAAVAIVVVVALLYFMKR